MRRGELSKNCGNRSTNHGPTIRRSVLITGVLKKLREKKELACTLPNEEARRRGGIQADRDLVGHGSRYLPGHLPSQVLAVIVVALDNSDIFVT
jgi:hypothetical protein